MSDDELFRAASAAWEAGTFESFLPTIEQALPRSRDYRLWHIHGLMLRQLERREEALPSLQRAVALKPDAAKPAHALAQTLYEAGLPSIDAFGNALRLANGSKEVVSGLAMAFVGAGEVHTAIEGMAKILARSPLWVEGHTTLADLRWMEGERTGFARSFEEALEQYPQSFDLWRELINSLVHAEQWDEARRIVAKGRSTVGDLPLFELSEAVILSETGDCAAADPIFDQYANADDGPIHVRRARHYLRWGRPDTAAAIIEPWLERPEAFMFWPYASLAWRLTDPARWEWLEGDERFVGVYDIAAELPPLDQLADTLRGLHKLSGQPLEQSLRGGTQSDGDIFARIDPVLVELREAIRRTVARHVSQLPPPDPKHPLLGPRRDRIAFAGSWSVRLRESGFHSNHVHPMGWISSALYVALPADLGQDEAGFLTIGDPRTTCFDFDMPPFRTIEPKPGRLALFPSYTWHGTKPFKGGERLTVAFDVAKFDQGTASLP
jgi:tetratricopeptide (TPR) repeat protein